MGGLGRYFWIGAALLGALMMVTLMRDLHRPICGLHSWAEAHSSWFGRTQLKYGMGYTKGLKTWAVGDPPKENPTRYLDHPQVQTLLNATGMYIFGWREDAPWEVKDSAMRKVGLVLALATLALLLMLLRGLLGDCAALLAGLFYVMFPLTGYFGVGSWIMPTVLLAIWCYAVLIGGVPGGPTAKARHIWGLAICLFMALQFDWSGFFYAAGIGVHYVGRCAFGKEWPKGKLLAVLIAAPLLSLALDFVIMAYGYGWEWKKIYDLFMWRATTGEKKVYTYGNLWADFWRHARTNFSVAVLIAAGVGLAWQLVRTVWRWSAGKGSAALGRGFPFLWVFLLPGVFQILTFKGALEQHQTWERPLSFFVAIGAALGVMLVGDLVGKLGRWLGGAAMAIVIGVICVQCAAGLDYYCGERYYSPTLVRMWQKLNAEIPPAKKLLAWHHYTITQHESKGTHYRPEVAWYLDREIVAAKSLAEIERQARTGQYPRYLIPYIRDLQPLWKQLQARYSWEYIAGDPKMGRDWRYGAFMIFNLERRK